MEIKAQETGETLFKGKKEDGLKQLEELKNTRKFNGKPLPIQVFIKGELKAEVNTNYAFNDLN